jgi:hypothetical protein
MSLSQIENKEELQQEFDLLETQIKEEKKADRKKAVISWISSLSLHMAALLIAMSLAFTMAEPDIEYAPTRTVAIHVQTQLDKIIPEKRELVENPVMIETETDKDITAPLTPLEVTDELTSSEDITETPSEIRRGREEAVSDSEMGGNAFTGVIGVGGPSSGMYGSRVGGGKIRARSKMGIQGKPADSSTDAGLRWLKKHQSPSGAWSATKYNLNCVDGLKCEPGTDQSGDEDVAMTGYSVLSFLGMGYDHKTPSKYRNVVKAGVSYLLSVQKPDGLMGERNYEHAVATMALIEAYGMSNDTDLREPAQKAVDVIIARQSIEKQDDPYSGLLWDYSKANISRADLSVDGWMIMSLKSAAGAGLNVKNSITGVKSALERVWKAANPNWEKLTDPYKDKSIFPYTWNALTNKTEKDHLSFVGATCSVFIGHKAGDMMLETLVNDAESRWIDSGTYKTNNYSCYYLSLVGFQMGGERWQKVLTTIIPNLIETQRKTDDCYDGSWDYDKQTWHGANTGRVLSTCYNILNLEVAYRYAQVHPEAKLPKK